MPAKSRWTAADVPDLTGKTVVITGANSGIGYEAAHVFARQGAQTILACRNLAKGEAARQAICRETPGASLALMQLDLADLESIRRFAETFQQKYAALDILCNNAGIMGLPYGRTADGFERQFGVNHLGHFALTGHLLERVLQAPNGRVVTVSSLYHYLGSIDFNHLNDLQSYRRFGAYARSKLANLLFAFELQRKLSLWTTGAISVAAHPGYAATRLQTTAPEMSGSRFQKLIMTLSNLLFAQSAAAGALPILYAAVAPNVRGGDYIGPGGLFELWGYPTNVGSNEKAHDRALAARLWAISEALTGVRY